MNHQVSLLAVLLILISTMHSVPGADCDPGLPINEADNLAYHERGERCEGVFVKQLGGEVLRIAELAKALNDFTPDINTPWMISWPKVATSNVQLRAISLRERLYYRMDTVRAGDTPPFKWPTDVLADPALNLSRSEIAISGWIYHTLRDGKEINLYLPIVVTPEATANTAKDVYNLIILPGFQLDQAYFTLRNYDDEEIGPTIKNEEELLYYPSDRPITIKLGPPDIAPSHEYYFTVSARITGGGGASIEGLFLCPPYDSKLKH